MADASIDILISVKPDAGAEQAVKKTLADIKRVAESEGRVIGQSSAKAITTGISGTSTKKAIEENLITGIKQATGNARKSMQSAYEEIFKVDSAVKSFATKKILDDLLINPIKQAKGDVRKATQSLYDELFGAVPTQPKTLMQKMVDGDEKAVRQMAKLYDEAVAMNKKLDAAANQTVYSRAGVADPRESIVKVNALREAIVKVKADMSAGLLPKDIGSAAIDDYNRKINVLTEGNARARGSLHKLIAGFASLAFEVTGAVYGFTMLAGIFSAPAMFGGKFLKSIEDAKHGITAVLTAMSAANGGTLDYAGASAIASSQIEKLNDSAVKYNVSLEDITKTYQAIVGPGLAAGMTLSEVGRIATIGTVAVKTLGLDSRQVVQEVRDLFGGIQAASSTLATALGLKDKDINEAKKSSEGLFVFLENRLAGFSIAAAERQNTLTGAFDSLKMKMQRVFADPAIYESFKNVINQISNSIAKVNEDTGKLEINPKITEFISAYMKAVNAIVDTTSAVISFTAKWSSELMLLAGGFAAFSLASTKSGSAILAFAANVVTSTATTSSSIEAIKSSILSLASTDALSGFLSKYKYGLIGVAIFGLYEVADMLGVVDKIWDSFFGGAERRLNEFRNRISSYSTSQVEKAKETVSSNITTIRKQQYEVAGGGIVTPRMGLLASGEVVTQEELANLSEATRATAKLVDGERLLNDQLAQQKELSQQLKLSWKAESTEAYEQARLQSGEAQKALRAGANLLKDRESALNEYDSKVAQYNKNRQVALQTLTDSKEDVKKRIDIENDYTRAIKAAEQERDKALSQGSRVQEKHFKSLLQVYQTFEKQLQEEVASGTISFVGEYNARLEKLAEISKSAVSNTDIQYVNKEIAEAGKKYSSVLKATGKDVKDLWVDVFGETLSEGDKWFAEFENKFETLRNVVAGALVDAKTPEQIAKLTAMYEQLAKAFNLAPQVKVLKELQTEVSNLNTAYETRIAQLELEAALAGGGAMVELNAQYAIQAERLGQIAEQQAKIDAFKIANPEIGAEAKKQLDEMNRALVVLQTNAARGANELDRSFGKGAKDAFDAYVENAKNAAEQAKSVFRVASTAMEDAITKFVTTGKLSFADFTKTVLAELLRIQVAKTVALGASAISPWVTAGLSALMGGSGSAGPSAGTEVVNTPQTYSIPIQQAMGGVWESGIQKFAMGGAFTNSIVNTPTLFPFAKGIGLMGEAGPEAIMPLARMPSGHLGVRSEGSGGTSVIVNVNIDSSGKADTTVAGADGKELGQIISRVVVDEIVKQKRNGGLLDGRR